jgi:hypothetical protein
MKANDLDRLLHSAANAPAELPVEAPFGFATRVVAGWRSGKNGGNDAAELSRFLQRAGVIAAAVFVLASGAAYRQYREESKFAAPTNEYLIVDSAIQTEFSQ